jgi:hypothetical protein
MHVVHVQSTQVDLLINQVDLLGKQQADILGELRKKDAELQAFIKIQGENAEVLKVQNEVKQFYLKTACCIVAGVVVLVILGTILPGSFSITNSIQDNISYFQTKKEFNIQDLETATNLLVEVVNERRVKISIREMGGTGDYVSLTNYIKGLQESLSQASLSGNLEYLDPVVGINIMSQTNQTVIGHLMSQGITPIY